MYYDIEIPQDSRFARGTGLRALSCRCSSLESRARTTILNPLSFVLKTRQAPGFNGLNRHAQAKRGMQFLLYVEQKSRRALHLEAYLVQCASLCDNHTVFPHFYKTAQNILQGRGI